MAVDHKGLGAVQPEPIAGTHRLHLGLQRAMLGALVDGERGEQRAIRYLRQIFGPLRGAAAARQRGSRQHGGGQKRRRHQAAADLLHHHAGFDTAKPAAAEIFRHQQARKTHFGEVRHSSRENPVASPASRSCRRCDTGALSLMRPRALSRSMDCSSVRTRAMAGFRFRVGLDELLLGGHSGAAPTDPRQARPDGVEPGISRFRVRVFDAPRNDALVAAGLKPPADRECAWRRCRASPPRCRPRSNWPWCAARRAAARRLSSARSPIPAHRSPPADIRIS